MTVQFPPAAVITAADCSYILCFIIFCARSAGNDGLSEKRPEGFSLLADNAFQGNTIFAKVLAGGRTLAFGTVVAAAALAGGKRCGGLTTDLTGFFFLGHNSPPLK